MKFVNRKKYSQL